MWIFDKPKGEVKGQADDFGKLVMAIKEVGEGLEAVRTRLSKLEQSSSEGLRERIEEFDQELQNFRGEWMNAQGHLKTLYGRVTKREALQKAQENQEQQEFKDADDVLAFARAKGLSR